MFALVEWGKTAQRSQVFASDEFWSISSCADFALPNFALPHPQPLGLDCAVGNPFGTLYTAQGSVARRVSASSSTIRSEPIFDQIEIIRSRKPVSLVLDHASALHLQIQQENAVATEQLVPARVLMGLLPDVILDHFSFWRISARVIYGYLTSSGFWTDKLLRVEISQLDRAVVQLLDLSQLEPVQPHLLINLFDQHENSGARSLAATLTRIESISHVLCWSLLDPSSETAQPAVLELPRLRLRFIFKSLDPLVIESSDFAGCFLDLDVPVSTSDSFPYSLALKDKFRQESVLAPNYHLEPVEVQSCPLTTSVRRRISSDWLAAVKTPYYLYSRHVDR